VGRGLDLTDGDIVFRYRLRLSGAAIFAPFLVERGSTARAAVKRNERDA
jgi:hypothetical protein